MFLMTKIQSGLKMIVRIGLVNTLQLLRRNGYHVSFCGNDLLAISNRRSIKTLSNC